MSQGAIGQVDELFDGVGDEIARLTKRWAVVFSDVESIHHWRAVMVGMRYVRTGIWVKPDAMPQMSGDRPAVGFEPATIMHANGAMRWNGGGHAAVWTHNVVKGTASDRPDHPCPKPLPLMRELVSLFTDPGETILDPFMGSGTTLRAAKDLGRKAIGIELEEKWCEVAAKRMSQSVLPLYEGWADNGWMVKSGYVEEPA
jgi:site-specific DNA-methyltransferase (adenine-specific)